MDEVTDDTFATEVLASQLPVIVDFWAPWCKPCDTIEPHLVAIADESAGRVRVVRMNVDENIGVPSRYGVLSLPTVVLFAAGEACATVYGAQSREHYARAFAHIFVRDENLYAFHGRKFADNFSVDPRNGRETSGPVVFVVRPGQPGSFVRLPFRGHPKTLLTRGQ